MTESVLERATRYVSALRRAVSEVESENLGLTAAGVAFYGMFAIFPGIAALIAVFGLLADATVMEEQLALLRDLMPAAAYELLSGQIHALLGAQSGRLTWATVLSTLVALWSARAGVSALITGLNVVQGRPQRRNYRHLLVAMGLTLALIAVAVVALLLVVVAPIVLAFVPLGAATGLALQLVRWIAVFGVMLVGIGLLYRLGPTGGGHRWRWISPGSVLVVLAWCGASAALSLYLSNFGHYNQIYGSIGTVVAMLVWFYLSAYLVLLGAAFDLVVARRAERQRAQAQADATRP